MAKTRTYSFLLRVLPQRQFADNGNPVLRGTKPDVPTVMGEFSYHGHMVQTVGLAQGGQGMSSQDVRTANKILDNLDDLEDGDTIVLPSEQWVWFRDQLKKRVYGAALKEYEVFEDDVLALEPDKDAPESAD